MEFDFGFEFINVLTDWLDGNVESVTDLWQSLNQGYKALMAVGGFVTVLIVRWQWKRRFLFSERDYQIRVEVTTRYPSAEGAVFENEELATGQLATVFPNPFMQKAIREMRGRLIKYTKALASLDAKIKRYEKLMESAEGPAAVALHEKLEGLRAKRPELWLNATLGTLEPSKAGWLRRRKKKIKLEQEQQKSLLLFAESKIVEAYRDGAAMASCKDQSTGSQTVERVKLHFFFRADTWQSNEDRHQTYRIIVIPDWWLDKAPYELEGTIPFVPYAQDRLSDHIPAVRRVLRNDDGLAKEFKGRIGTKTVSVPAEH